MVEFELGDSKAILRLLHPFQTEMFAEMTEEWCLLFLQSKSESVQDVTRHRWGLWTYVTVTCFVHAGNPTQEKGISVQYKAGDPPAEIS